MWGEIRRFIQTAAHPLNADKGGPLVANHLHLRKMNYQRIDGKLTSEMCGLSYCIGRVAAKGEGMLGHHIADVGDGIPRTLWVADEASGVDDTSYERADTWANRKLVIGNCYASQSQNNFFERGVKGGDILIRES